MEGLEISEVKLSQVLASAETKRLDPEYFQIQHLKDARLVADLPDRFTDFRGINLRVDASAFYPSIEDHYDTGLLPFLRVGDVDSVIDFDKCIRIPRELCDKFPTLALVQPGDIVLTKGGSVARIGLVRQESAASRDLIFLNSSSLPETDRIFIYLYLQTNFFNRMLLRSSSQTAQPHLTITLVRNLPVAVASKSFKARCAEEIERAYQLLDQARTEAMKADQLLLDALGLASWQPPDPLTYTRRASEVFAARRVDSSYFSPRVSQLLQLLARDNMRIGDVAPARHEEFVAGSSGEFDYIEISDVQSDGTTGSNRLPQFEAPSRATWYIRPGDVIASTVRPIRRLSAIVTPEQDSFVCSSGFVVLAPQSVSPELLLTYLRLPQVCELMDLHTSASMYPAISEGDLLNLPFRRTSADVERKIVAAVRRAHSTRRESRNLLDRAKRAVEIAIEQSEAAALRYLSETVG